MSPAVRDGIGRPEANQGDAAECLNIILHETARLSSVLTDFLDYAKPRRNLPQTHCHPIRVIEHTAELILRDAKISVEIETEKEGITIEADPEALKQVLLNLFLNAVQAMEGYADRPSLKVKVREIDPGRGRNLRSFAETLPIFSLWENWKRPHGEEGMAGSNLEASYDGLVGGNGAEPMPFLEILVSDNGRGIGEAEVSHIFTPFFTTKPRGTGLGLAICQRLIEGMGGSIRVKSNEPTGSVFIIHLPMRVGSSVAPTNAAVTVASTPTLAVTEATGISEGMSQ